jgi:hypothetical protein
MLAEITLANVLAVATALGVAGLVGAWLESNRERRERMRDRMLVAADEFLTAAWEGYEAVERVMLSDESELRDGLTNMLEVLGRLDGRIPRLALLFPTRGEDFGPVVTEAISVTDAFREAVGLLEQRLGPRELEFEERSEAFRPISENLGAAMQKFAHKANRQLWSRSVQAPP